MPIRSRFIYESLMRVEDKQWPDRHSSKLLATWASCRAVVDQDLSIGLVPGGCCLLTPPQAKKNRRGGTPGGVLPRRRTCYRASRQKRVALQLVIRRLRSCRCWSPFYIHPHSTNTLIVRTCAGKANGLLYLARYHELYTSGNRRLLFGRPVQTIARRSF